MEEHQHHNYAGKALKLAFCLNAFFLIVEAIAGWWTGSLALLSDAVHMISDVAALGLAWAAAGLAARAATARTPYGFRRATTLGAFTNSLTLLFACAWIIFHAVQQLWSGQAPTQGLTIFIVGAIGLAINLGSAWGLYRSNDQGLNIRAAMTHLMSDAAGSLGAMIAAIGVSFGMGWLDSLLSLLIAVLILRSTFPILRESAAILMQAAPKNIPEYRISEILLAHPSVENAHAIRTWSLDDDKHVLSAHVVVKADVHNDLAHDLSQQLRELLSLEWITIQLERMGRCPDAVSENLEQPCG